MSAKLWDMTTYACTKTLRGHDHTVSAIAFFPGGDRLATCSRDETIKVWDVLSGYCSLTFSGHGDWVRCLSVSEDGEYVASGSIDHTIIIWKASSGQLVQQLRGHEHVVETVAFGKQSVGSAAVIAASGGAVQQAVLAIALPSDGAQAAVTLLASGSRDRTVRLWDPLKGTLLMVFPTHDNWVRSVLFHPSGKYLISCSDDKSIRVLDMKDQRAVRTIADAHTHFVTCLAWSISPPALVSGSVDRNLA
eukprot:gene583-631_t